MPLRMCVKGDAGLLSEGILQQWSPERHDFALWTRAQAFTGMQIGYLLGVPVTGYSLDIGKAHTDFAEAKIGSRLIERSLQDAEIDTLAVMAMAGVTAEAQAFEEVRLRLAQHLFQHAGHLACASRSQVL